MGRDDLIQELNSIEEIIAVSDEGLGVSAVEAALAAKGHPIPRRTLQRRLEALLKAGRLQSRGGSRSVAYSHVPRVLNRSVPLVLSEPDADARSLPYVRLSAAGLEVRTAVRRPLIERRPVAYDRAFLERYRPNQDFYLSEPQRARLHEGGRTPGDARPAGTYARNIMGRLLIDLSWASSRLEGNTYTRLETMRLIEQGQAAEGKDADETRMILNHKAAIEMIVENAGEVDFDTFTLLNLHAALSQGLMSDPSASGRVRTCEVGISGTVFMPLASPWLLKECFEQVLDKAAQITDPFEQAFFAMVHLPYLQPFEDVNKRVSRLAANIPLIRHNLCPLSFVEVPEKAYIEGTLGVYEENRVELLRDVFVWAYERSCMRYLALRRTIGEPDAFSLLYRVAMKQAIWEVVIDKLQGTREQIEMLVGNAVPRDDIPPFVDAVQFELDSLHPGNIARYRLRLSEFQDWPYKRPGV